MGVKGYPTGENWYSTKEGIYTPKASYVDASVGAVDYAARVVADGGTVVSMGDILETYRFISKNGLGTNLKGWYSPQFGYKDAGSAKVSKLYDLSVNNNDLAQATAGLQPTWTANRNNGRSGLVFAADRLYSASIVPYSQPNTIIMVIYKSVNTRCCYCDGIATGHRNCILDWYTTYYLEFYAGTAEVYSASYGNNSRFIIAGLFNGASSILWRNGLNIKSGTTPGTNDLTGFTIGNAAADDVTFTGDIYEAIFFNADMTASIDAITMFLQSRWLA
jgi:hypothetical protein